MKRVAILSILKPINDPRMYKKIGASLAATRKYEVHIIGYKAPIPITSLSIFFYPLFSFDRISWQRVFTFWKTYRNLVKVKPHIIIPNTHENLIVSILYKILFGVIIIYDIRENYFRNIWFQKNYPFIIRHLLAIYVRSKEWVAHFFINHYLIAEKTYLEELPFVKNKFTLIENKYLPEEGFIIKPLKKTVQEPIHLIYSGTIGYTYGILEAIELAKSLHKNSYNITLCIIGYCANNQLLKYIKVKLEDAPYITLMGGDKPVPHAEIIKEIKKATLALTPYQWNKSTQNCIPTKFYEYIAHQIPIVIPSNNPLWISFISSFNAGISFDFKNINSDLFISNIKNKSFYMLNNSFKEILWDQESSKLINLFFSLD